MKKLLAGLIILVLANRLLAQSNAPVRLALIAETGDASTVADILTAQLSKDPQIQLLERDEIEKVYREQGLSAANKDYLKLGRILGADGLLLFNVVRTPQTTNFTARLIAVKPGVVLTDGSFPWPLKDTISWAESVAPYLNSFLPKLAVLVKDAIPVSVVNLRSAVQSAEAQETERQLKLLIIQRLSQERQFFVLERQKMQLLSGEKELKVDESAFWNGSYLLEGVVDQNGYSKETLTINARLTPPKGGAPLLFEASGSRTNLSEVINRLAAKVTELLKVNSVIKEWNTADEAAQYYEEAKWALKWGVLAEAQAAADSAWALGRRDIDSAIVRIRAYKNSLKAMRISVAGSIDSSIVDRPEPAERAQLTRMIKNLSESHPAILFETNTAGINYIVFDESPDPQAIDCAAHALQLYYEFSRASAEGELKVARDLKTGRRENSAWYNLGIEDLEAASEVLHSFYLVPASRKEVAEKLSDLRERARAVAELISRAPTIHDSYFVGERLATHDELDETIYSKPNIFSCQLKWGSLWQETPEDSIALYRELMGSPVFCYIHHILWSHQLQLPEEVDYADHNLEPPRLVAWKEQDRQRIPLVWGNFLKELSDSTNIFLQLEAKAIQFADANTEAQMGKTFTNFFDAVLANRDALVTNAVEVSYLNWGTDDLINSRRGVGPIPVSTPDSLQRQFYSDYRPKLEAMNREYWSKTVPRAQAGEAFKKQVEYLKNNTPYNHFEFIQVFQTRDYTKAQAMELLPLLTTYQSNLVAEAERKSPGNSFKTKHDSDWIEFYVGKRAKEILNPPAPKPNIETAQNTNRRPAQIAPSQVVPTMSEAPAKVVANVLLVNNFLKIPQNRFTATNIAGLKISANHWRNGTLLVDLTYRGDFYAGDYQEAAGVLLAAAAIYDPGKGRWEILEYPQGRTFDNSFGYKTRNIELFDGDFYLNVDGQIKKYRFNAKQWETLNVRVQNNSRLFAVDGHLYAADPEGILEITDGGKGTHILASTRRRPAASALDSLDNLGWPILFGGPNHSLCAITGDKVWAWNGSDWTESFSLIFPQASSEVEVFEDAVSFRFKLADYSAMLWLWEKSKPAPELILYQKSKPPPGVTLGSKPAAPPAKPLWTLPGADSLANSGAAVYKSNLYCFIDHAVVTRVSGHWTVAEKNGYHAKLICLNHDLPEPIVVPLKFDVERGQPPLRSLGEKFETAPWLTGATWMFFAGDTLYIGQPDSPGIWAIPVSEVEAAITAQKQLQLARKSQSAAAAEQARKTLLAKYDHNHNGVIDPEEKLEALDDPAFIEFELGNIDTNHNSRLDAEELVWFDPNQNKVLEPKEQAGIEIAQQLLAAKLLKEFDADGNGVLDRPEFDDLFQSSMGTNALPIHNFSFPFPDDNHNGWVDPEELASFLNWHTRGKLKVRGVSRSVLYNQMGVDPHQQVDPGQMFKAEVEFYWQHPGGITNGPPFNRRIPPGRGGVTNDMQNGKTP
jgi:hypothetical protein